MAPRYKDENFVFDDVPLQTLRFQVYDWNAGLMGMGSGKAKPLGEVSVDLAQRWAAQPDAGPDGRGVAEWLKLDALEGQRGAAWKSTSEFIDGDSVASMAWKLYAIEQSWEQHLISTQARRRRGRGQDFVDGRHGRRPGRRGQGRRQR